MGNIEKKGHTTCIREKLTLNDAISKMQTMPQAECPTNHYFAEGQYVRETFMPKGALVIGKKHKTECINILMKGSIRVLIGENGEVKDLTAPYVFTTEAGIQKAGYILEDTIWLNCIPTTETDIDKIEKETVFDINETYIIENNSTHNTEEHY